jgi:hypothetical protein
MVVCARDREFKREVPPDIHGITVLVYSLESELNFGHPIGTARTTATIGIVERHRNQPIHGVEVKELKVALGVRG